MGCLYSLLIVASSGRPSGLSDRSRVGTHYPTCMPRVGDFSSAGVRVLISPTFRDVRLVLGFPLHRKAFCPPSSVSVWGDAARLGSLFSAASVEHGVVDVDGKAALRT
jgi:hypothetical protein